MSSLLQHRGKVDQLGVHIVGLLVREDEESPFGKTEVETYCCSRCGGDHGLPFTFARKPAGMFGCWVVFRVNGEKRPLDLSTPIDLYKKPMGETILLNLLI